MSTERQEDEAHGGEKQNNQINNQMVTMTELVKVKQKIDAFQSYMF